MHIPTPKTTIELSEAVETAQQMKVSATAFLDSLGPGQRRKTGFRITDDERTCWDYRPVPRSGLPLAEMDSSQQRRALALLASGMSRSGNITALNIMSLETILAGLEGSFNSLIRNPELYFVTIFGDPSCDKAWGWRIEGHHLSVHFLIVDSCRVACSPNFFGANPARVPEGSLEGFRTLPEEEDAARKLLTMLDGRQLGRAVIDETAPSDIITQWTPRIRLDDPVGIALSEMTAEQQQAAKKLIHVYLGRMAPQLADNQLESIEGQGIDYIHFAWAGAMQPGDPHYYRLHGPSFLVEYDNTQDNANHIHSVWRDLQRDWGDDLLREHYANAHQADAC